MRYAATAVLAAALLFAAPWQLKSQNYDEFKREALNRFNNTSRDWKKAYKDFRDKANAEFAEELGKGWTAFKLRPPVPDPDPEPVVPLVVMPPIEDPVVEDTPLVIEDIIFCKDDNLTAPAPIAPVKKPVAPQPTASFSAFGCRYEVSSPATVKLASCDGKTLSAAWLELSGDKNDAFLHDVLELRSGLDLCDWAYYELCRAASGAFCPYGSNSEVLFTAYALSQSGFKIRLAVSPESGDLHILAATDASMFRHPYWTLDGADFYLLDDSSEYYLEICQYSFPGERPMRLLTPAGNNFGGPVSDLRHLVSSRYPAMRGEICSNKALVGFYDSYPVAFTNGDTRTRWRHYAMNSLSPSAKESLYPMLRSSIEGKGQLEAVNMLLNFVQTAFVYEYDDKVWGGDRAFFPEETLFYPYCDCEDRSILFSRLVRDFLGLDVVLIYYPGHLATAVCFTDEVTGDYIPVSGRKFVVCDPTYIGAPVGRTMPDMDNSQAYVIVL